MVQTLESTFLHRLTTGYENYSHTIFAKCYTTTTLRHITGKDYSTSIYIHLWAAKQDAPKMWIFLQGPSTEWSQVWKNLHNVPINGAIRSTCYRTIHDLIPTQIRPSRIHPVLFQTYPLPHPTTYFIHLRNAKKLLTYGAGHGQNGHHPAHRLPLHPYHPATWLLFPNMSIWPSPKHEAILCRSYGLSCHQP